MAEGKSADGRASCIAIQRKSVAAEGKSVNGRARPRSPDGRTFTAVDGAPGL
jgi:hypothetical protein